MPQLQDDVLTRALYRSVVRGPITRDSVVLEPAIVETYGRQFFAANWQFGTRKDWLTGYGLDNNADVLVIGCGFGFLVEELVAAGIQAWGIEGGSFYWDAAQDAEWDPAVKARVANDWIGSGTEKASLQAIDAGSAQATFNWIIDEDAAPMHSDAELPAFIAACEDRLQGNAKGRIVHLVTTVGPLGAGNQAVNWKTLAEWKAVAPDHTWVDISTSEVAA